jgi:DNA-binding transcriptional LysR family regulator
MDRLKSLQTLTMVIETGGFSKAARALGVGQPAVSKAIGMLEREFGVKLLNRGTHISPTEDGVRLYEEARKVVDAYGGLQEVTARKSTPMGLVRVTCPNALGTLYLIPKLKEFLRFYPEITVELRVSDAFVDLHENDIDVAIRVGEPRGDRLIAKKVCDLKRVAVGAASYFQDHAIPRKPQDLQNHACVIVGHTHGTDDWPYVTPGGARSSIEVFGRVVVDNHLALRTAVEAGLGIGLAAGFIYDGEGLDSGRLVRVLPEYEFRPFPLHLMFKDARLIPARVRLFIDFLYADLKRQPWAAA